MAKSQAFKTKQTNFNEYLQQLEDLLRKNRGSAVYEGYDVDPNAILVPGKVSDPTGLGSQQYNDATRFAPYSPTSTRFEAPNLGAAATQKAETPTQGQTAADFFSQVAQATYAPKVPSQQSQAELENIFQQTGQKYAIASNQDGTVTYNDGSVGRLDSQSFPMASMADGNVLWSDGMVRSQLPDYLQGSGVGALSMGLFGSEQAVTQPFGNINPIEPTPGNVNLGTDFRTRNLQSKEIKNFFAEPLEVVEVYNQAQPGSGSVGNMENRGYGNSILLRRQDGSMIRVSHFDQLGDFRAGDQIQPGQMIGVPGTTGNITGEHADVEVYSPEGQIVSPDQFIASVRESSTSNEPLYKYDQPENIRPEQQSQEAQRPPTPVTDAITAARDYAQQFKPAQAVQEAIQPASPQRQAVSQVPEQIAQKTGLDTEFGGSEFLKEGYDASRQARVSALSQQPKQTQDRGLFGNLRQLAGNVTERIGDTLGVPEGAFSETLAGNPGS